MGLLGQFLPSTPSVFRGEGSVSTSRPVGIRANHFPPMEGTPAPLVSNAEDDAVDLLAELKQVFLDWVLEKEDRPIGINQLGSNQFLQPAVAAPVAVNIPPVPNGPNPFAIGSALPAVAPIASPEAAPQAPVVQAEAPSSVFFRTVPTFQDDFFLKSMALR